MYVIVYKCRPDHIQYHIWAYLTKHNSYRYVITDGKLKKEWRTTTDVRYKGHAMQDPFDFIIKIKKLLTTKLFGYKNSQILYVFGSLDFKLTFT